MGGTTDLATLLEGFRLSCLAEGKPHTTIRWYLGKLKIFLDYLQAQDLPTSAPQLTTTHLRAFLVHLRQDVKADEHNPMKHAKDRGLSPRTIQGYARTLKVFFSWLTQEGYISENPSTLVRIPNAPRTMIKTLDESQVKRFLSEVDSRSSEGFRDYCIILVFLDTGVRLSELVNLNLEDSDLERGLFRVMGKGSRERLVPFGAKVQRALWKYVHRFRPEPFHPNIGNLFIRADGNAMSCGQVYRLIKRYGRKAGIEGVRCSPHTFRHTFARNFLINGGDLFTLQKILGHSSLYVVRMYVELAPEDIQVLHRRHSPVDRARF